MRVLILHSRYLTGPASGENRVVEDEADLLREGGHEVHVWDPSLEADSGLQLAVAAGRTVWNRGASQTAAGLVRSFRPDVVHVHNLFPALSPAVLRVTSDARVPTVMTLHNYRFGCLPGTFFRDGRVCEDCLGHLPWRGVMHGCFRDSVPASAALATSIELHRAIGTFDRIARFLAVSEFLRGKVIEAGLASERVVVKPNFAWRGQRRTDHGTRFLFLGRLAPEKGVDTAVRAFAQVPEAELLVVGEGPERERLRAMAPQNVTFEDTVPGERVPSLLADARALVVPSAWYEGSPRSITEAFAAGVPVLAGRIGAMPEVVDDGRTGLLLPVGEPQAWATGIRDLLDDEKNQRLGEAAYATWAAVYSPERALGNLERTYAEVVDPSASP